MAQARWKKDSERRDEIAAREQIDPLRAPGRIIMRVVVIHDESRVVEIIRRATTSAREWDRRKRAAGL